MYAYIYVCMYVCVYIYMYIIIIYNIIYIYVFMYIYVCMYIYIYVTGFWKTDRNVTLGLFHFIGPANAYTHTLHIRTAIIRLG